MASDARDWIGAAPRCEGSWPAATFTDLPRKSQWELMRLAFAATLSTAYFVAAAVLARPLPSRSLAAHIILPEATVVPAALPDVSLDASVSLEASVVAPSQLPMLERAMRQGPTMKLASLHKPLADDSPMVPAPPRSERRRNIFSRFFRGVFHGTSAAAAGADMP
jgi:hypothetical protein